MAGYDVSSIALAKLPSLPKPYPDTRTLPSYFGGMKKKLTPKTIEALPPASGKRYEVNDALLPGLHLRVSATGGKVFGVSRRVNGRMKRIRIGAYPIMSLADAREKARDVLRDIELGQYNETSPFVAEPAPRLPLGEVLPQFIELYTKPRKTARETPAPHQRPTI